MLHTHGNYNDYLMKYQIATCKINKLSLTWRPHHGRFCHRGKDSL